MRIQRELRLDTHALVWYFVGSKRLHERFRAVIDDTRAKGGRLLVPTIVLAEALYISERRPEALDFNAMLARVRDDPGFEVVAFDAEVLDEVLRIHRVPELHDRIIGATARFYGAGVPTKDRILRASGEVEAP